MTNYLDIIPNEILSHIYKYVHKAHMKNIFTDIVNFDKFQLKITPRSKIISKFQNENKSKIHNLIMSVMNKNNELAFFKWYKQYYEIQKEYKFKVFVEFWNFPQFCDLFKKVPQDKNFYIIYPNYFLKKINIQYNLLWIDLIKFIDRYISIKNFSKNVFIIQNDKMITINFNNKII